jgi:hypothetical protein
MPSSLQVSARLILACVVLMGLASPASARKYYVVQNTTTHKCSVLPKKPKGKTVVIVGGTTWYRIERGSRERAGCASPRVAVSHIAQEKPRRGGQRGSSQGGKRTARIA